jgi:arylsulfatase
MPKNILLILTDQQRFDSLSTYSCQCIKTPHIDSLGKGGVVFDNCYVNNPVCTPSRASIFTGKPITGHNVYRLHDNLPEHETPFPYLLQQAGYTTALFGKLHLSSRIFEDSHRHPRDGFDIYKESKSPYLPPSKMNSYLPWLQENFPEEYDKLQEKKRQYGHFSEETHLSHWIASSAIDFLKHQDRDKPFFCYASFFDPHDPYNDYPVSMEKQVDESELMNIIPGPENWSDMPEGIQREHFNGYLGCAEDLSPEALRSIRLGYYASVAFIDKQVGRILTALEELGLRDDTLIIYTSDHGDMLGDHSLLAKGAYFYEPCTKVPLIMNSPDLDAADFGRSQALVQGHDIAATILSYAGISETEFRGLMPESIDLHTSVKNCDASEQRSAVCLYRGTSIDSTKHYFDPPINAAMLRFKNYKLNLYFHAENAEQPIEGQLFDIDQDPHEQMDLYNNPDLLSVRNHLTALYTAKTNAMDLIYNSSRGGENFPPRSHWSQNNPL